jgi:hypothetical protein
MQIRTRISLHRRRQSLRRAAEMQRKEKPALRLLVTNSSPVSVRPDWTAPQLSLVPITRAKR